MTPTCNVGFLPPDVDSWLESNTRGSVAKSRRSPPPCSAMAATTAGHRPARAAITPRETGGDGDAAPGPASSGNATPVQGLPGSAARPGRLAQKERPYTHERMLYRGMDQGVTATSETHEQRVMRSKKCKSTGWQSRFAVPYRSLGTPDLELPAKGKAAGEELAGTEDRRGAAVQHGHGGLSARELRHIELGVTPAGRPLNWLPEARRTMVYFGEAAKRNRRVHRSVLLSQLAASDKRVKMVRAGQQATAVLEQDQHAANGGVSTARSAADAGTTFLTDVPASDVAAEPPSLQMPTSARRRPNHVPPLQLGAGTALGATSTPQTDSLASRGAQSSTARLALPTPPGTTARSGAATERARPAPAPAPLADDEHASKSARARANAMSGNVALVHPVPPLALVAEQFQHQVDGMTTHLKTELGVMQSERLDTFRRKFNNFDVSDLGSSSERRLASMRLSAQQAC